MEECFSGVFVSVAGRGMALSSPLMGNERLCGPIPRLAPRIGFRISFKDRYMGYNLCVWEGRDPNEAGKVLWGSRGRRVN